MSKLKPVVFISFASMDADIAQKLQKWLTEKYIGAITFFLSLDIKGGDEWIETIKKNLQRADLFILIATNNSLSRRWCMFEVGFAFSNEVPVIPVCFDAVLLNDLPYPVKIFQGYNLSDSKQVKKFLGRINSEFDMQVKISTPVIKGFHNALGAHYLLSAQPSLANYEKQVSKMLDSENFLERMTGLKMIASNYSEKSIRIIMQSLYDPNFHVRSVALESLAKITSDNSVNLVSLLLGELPDIPLEQAKDVISFIETIIQQADIQYLDKYIAHAEESRPTIKNRIKDIRNKANIQYVSSRINEYCDSLDIKFLNLEVLDNILHVRIKKGPIRFGDWNKLEEYLNSLGQNKIEEV